MLYLQLHYHFKFQILGPKNGSCATESPSASQGGWVFSIAILHHCGRDLEGQVRDRLCLHQFSPCKFNLNCDHPCSRRRSPLPPTMTPSWTGCNRTLKSASIGSPGLPGNAVSATTSAASDFNPEVGQGCPKEDWPPALLLAAGRRGWQRGG